MMLRTCRAAVALMFVFLCVCFLKGLLVTSVSCPDFTKVPDTRFLLSTFWSHWEHMGCAAVVSYSEGRVQLPLPRESWPSQNLDYKPPSFGRIELPQYQAAS